LFQNTYQNKKVIVLDNQSTDGSLGAIRESYPEVQIIELKENLGYAGNNNIGIEIALQQAAEWVFVLNDDIVLDRECLSNLIEIGQCDTQIGILGPLVFHHDEPDFIQSAGGVLGRNWESMHAGQNELDQGRYREPRRVDWISGCAILVRRSVIEQVGVLDDRFYLYWEETEWCIRASKAGWKIVLVPQAKVWHKGVQRNYQPKASFSYYGTRNHLLTLSKHRAPFRAKIFTWIQIIRTLVSWSIKPKWRSKREHRNAMWKGLVDYLRRRWGPMPS
jgi:GT2 family glycosyltransferase